MCAVMGVLGAAVRPLMIHHEVLLWTMLFLWAGFTQALYGCDDSCGQWSGGSELATAMSAFGFLGLGAFAGPLVEWACYGHLESLRLTACAVNCANRRPGDEPGGSGLSA